MTNETKREGEGWRISESPPDGSWPFRIRVLAGEQRETRVVAMFMLQADAEGACADHNAAASLRMATEALRERIKDTNWHPQYTLGLAYAYGLLTGEIKAPLARIQAQRDRKDGE